MWSQIASCESSFITATKKPKTTRWKSPLFASIIIPSNFFLLPEDDKWDVLWIFIFFLQPLKKNSSRGELNKILSLFLVVIPKCTFQRFFFSKLKLEGKSREIKSRNNFFPLFTYFFYHHHRRRRHRERRKRKWLLCVESSSLFYTFNSSSSSNKWFNEILTVWRGPLLSN